MFLRLKEANKAKVLDRTAKGEKTAAEGFADCRLVLERPAPLNFAKDIARYGTLPLRPEGTESHRQRHKAVFYRAGSGRWGKAAHTKAEQRPEMKRCRRGNTERNTAGKTVSSNATWQTQTREPRRRSLSSDLPRGSLVQTKTTRDRLRLFRRRGRFFSRQT
jgi:hypothetical protein